MDRAASRSAAVIGSRIFVCHLQVSQHVGAPVAAVDRHPLARPGVVLGRVGWPVDGWQVRGLVVGEVDSPCFGQRAAPMSQARASG